MAIISTDSDARKNAKKRRDEVVTHMLIKTIPRLQTSAGCVAYVGATLFLHSENGKSDHVGVRDG